MFFKQVAFVVFAAAATLVRAGSDDESSASKSGSASSSSETGSSGSDSSSSSSSGGPLKINTPTSVVTCQPVQITWSGGKKPYFLSVIPGEQPAAAPIIQFNETEKTSFKWEVNMAPTSFITIQLKDSEGNLNYAAALNIQEGQDDKCVDPKLPVPEGTASTGGSTSSGTSGTSSGTTTTDTSTTEDDSTSDTTAEDSTAPEDEEASASRFVLSGTAALAAALVYAL